MKYYEQYTREINNMTDQTNRLIDEIPSKNKSENYHKQNTDKLYILKDIWKNTNGLDDITEHMKRKWDSILLG